MSVIGIDFGNLNVVVGAARKRGIDILLDSSSNRQTPNLVVFTDQARQMGEFGAPMAMQNYKNAITNAKRLVGLKYNDPRAQQELERWQYPFKVVEMPDGSCGYQVRLNGESMTVSVEQVLSMILGHIKRNAERENAGAVASDVVIAVPAYWTDAQRRAFLDAAEIADLKVSRLVNDTTAAAVQYGFPIPVKQFEGGLTRTVAFVDCGHADLQASIVTFDAEGLRVKTIRCDENLGGRDFDRLLYDHFVAQFKTTYGIDINTNPKARLRLEKAVEKMKKTLSANSEAGLSVECIMDDVDVKGSITRDEFLEMAEPLFQRVINTLTALLDDAKLEEGQLDSVEIVGGTTRMPKMKEIIASAFGMDVNNTLNNEEALASGCSWAAAMLSTFKKMKKYTVHDCTLYPIKLVWKSAEASSDNVYKSSNVFKHFNNFPSTKLLSLYQFDSFDIHAEYSDPELLPTGTLPHIADFHVSGLPNETSGKIKARVRLDLHGLVSVESCTLHDEVELTEEEIKAEAEAQAKDDKGNSSGDSMDTEPSKSEDGEEGAKTKKVKTPLTVTTTSSAMTYQQVQDAKELEGKLMAADNLVAATADARNSLESFVYDTRYKVESELAPYCTEQFRTDFLGSLSAAEEWLYEDGYDATKSVYDDKLKQLRAPLKPVQARYNDDQTRDIAATELKSLTQHLISEAQSGDAKYEHLAAEDLQKVVDTATAAEQWLEASMAEQQGRDRTLDAVITTKEINERKDAVNYTCQPILTKKKVEVPKPKSTGSSSSSNNDNKDDASADDTAQDSANTEDAANAADEPVEDDLD